MSDLFGDDAMDWIDGAPLFICKQCGALVPSSPPNQTPERDWMLKHFLFHQTLDQ